MSDQIFLQHVYKYMMILFDQFLTEKPIEACEKSFKDNNIDLFHFLEGEIYYLSDGGYSRIVFDYRSGLFLTSNSLQIPKNNFEINSTIKRHLNHFLLETYQELENKEKESYEKVWGTDEEQDPRTIEELCEEIEDGISLCLNKEK